MFCDREVPVERFPELCETIRELHTYDVPEVVSLAIDDGDEPYLNWIVESVKQAEAE